MKDHEEDAAILICVAGAVGAGKTTLARKLGKSLHATVLEEEVSGNELLESFYRDPLHYALPVQEKFLLSRFCQLRSDSWKKDGTVVADYIFDKDRLFADLNLKGKELQLHRGLWQTLKDRVHQPQLVIYLRAQPELLLQRIRQRDRSFERTMELTYLQRLVQSYEKMFSTYDRCPVIRVDSSSEPARNQHSWRELNEKLISALPELAQSQI